jgi:hypothetical protein
MVLPSHGLSCLRTHRNKPDLEELLVDMAMKLEGGQAPTALDRDSGEVE